MSKTDPRVDAAGEVDELNAWFGFVRASNIDPDIAETLKHLQHDLFAVSTQLVDPTDGLPTRVAKGVIDDPDVKRLEDSIEHFHSELRPVTPFLAADGTRPGAGLHVARAVCRRAERRVVGLALPADAVLVRYLNRLSDLLFTMARATNHRAGLPETEW